MIVTAHGVTKRYGRETALDDVTFSLRGDAIVGLLGRNGAGKTTLMRILTGQGLATSGDVRVFGASPYENDTVLADVCFVKESQLYPDTYTVSHALRAARLLFPHWDETFAQSLVAEFGLPRTRRVKKLSRGMVSALGVTIGLASRARLTLFDEPYLGLDAVARQLFYDRLLADFAQRPRTIILSTHLIDEVSELVEHVLLLDKGRLVVDADTESLRGQAVTVTGPSDMVEKLVATRETLNREQLGSTVRVTVRGLDADDRVRASSLGLHLQQLSLQQLVVHLTSDHATFPEKEPVR